jgi:hypothetical protein
MYSLFPSMATRKPWISKGMTVRGRFNQQFPKQDLGCQQDKFSGKSTGQLYANSS